MGKSIQINILTTADLKGVTDVTKALQGLGQAASKATAGSAGGGGLAKPLQQAGQAAAQAEKQILALASAQARLQSTQGNTAGAASTLSAALAKVDQSSIAGIRSQTQLAQIQNKLSGQTQGLTSLFAGQNSVIAQLGGQFSSLGGTVGGLSGSIGQLAGSFGTLGAIGAAIGIAKVGVDLAQVGANADLVRLRFNGLAQAAGTTGDALLGALRKASGGEISDLNLQLAANRAQLLGVASSAEQFGVLMGIARDRAQQMGITTTQAFNDLVTGLGRGSRLILDNLGIIVNADAANQAYAASIGKTVAALSEEEKKQALINQVLKDGQATIAATGGAIDSNAASFARAGTAFSNAQNSLGSFLAEGMAPTLNSFSTFVESSQNAVASIEQFAQSNANATAQTAAAAAGRLAYNAALQDGATADQAAAAAQAAYTAALGQGAAAAQVSTDIEQQRANALAQAATLAQQVTQAELGYANSLEMSTVQANAAAQAAQQKANADQVAAVDAQTHAVAQQQLTDAAMNAARALLAAGGQGAATANTLAASSQQVDVLTAAYYRLFAAQQAVGVAAQKAKARTDDFAERHGGAGGADLTAGARARAAADQKLNDKIAAAKHAADVKAAKDEQTLAVGTAAQKAKIYQAEYQQAVARYGAESTEAVKAQTKLLQAQQQGSAARASGAAATSNKLTQLEQTTGNKIQEIDANTQQKLIEIDQKAADERARIQQELVNKIATTQADMRAQQEADDLELIGVTDAKQAQALNDREQAQAAAREREAAAAKEAQDAIANGEADSASKVYDIRQKQISDQQQLDEDYAKRQRELADNPDALAALKQQYDEATRAINEAADTRIAIAKAESDQKKAAVQEEKDAVIAAAEDQKNQVVGKAQQSAQGVMKASAEARAKAVSDLQAIGKAVDAIPTSKTITITTEQKGSTETGGGGGTNKAAGGGTFMTKGRTHLTVGDNPGGRELVTVTPLSGRGRSHASGNLIALAGGGQVVVDAGNGFTTPVAGGTPTKPAGKSGGKGKGGASGPVDAKKALDEMKNTVQLLMDMAKLKEQIAALAGVPAFDIPVVQALVNRAQEFTAYVMSHLVPITKKEGESLDAYFKATQGAADLIGNMAELKKQIAELKDVPAFDQPVVLALIDRAQQFTRAMQSRLIPLTEFEAEQFSRYSDAVGSTVSILKDVADLKKDLAASGNAILRDTTIISIANDAARIATIVNQRMVPFGKEQAEGLSTYADAVGSSVSALKDVVSLQKDMFDNYSSPTDAQLALLAIDARRVAAAFMAGGRVMSKDAAEAGKTYAEGVQAAFGAAKDGLLVIEALKSGDFTVSAGSLDQFKTTSLSVLDVMSALGAKASTIPTAAITALQSTTAAISSQADALIKLAAVPFGDIGPAAQAFAQQGGVGGGGTIINNTFVLPPGSTRDTANEVIRILGQQTSTRR